MRYKYDLHLHSSWSDGDYSILEVFKLAKKLGLKTISITDHNVMAPQLEIDGAKKITGIDFVEGIEITTNYLGIDVHLLGYSSNFDKVILKRALKKTLIGYEKRCIQIAKKMEKIFSIEINIKKIKKERGKKPLFKYDIIKEAGKLTKKSIEEISKLCIRGGAAYIPYDNWAMAPSQALKLIKKAGGICVIAHPCTPARSNFPLVKTQKIIFDLIKKLVKQGLNGIEVYYPTHSSKQIGLLKHLAKKYNLLITGGSDWHGEFFKPNIKMGSGGIVLKNLILIKHLIKVGRT